jgi:tRNA(adenine34) deaminase
MEKHEHYMRQALREAQLAYEAGEVPVGAVVVMQDRIIGRGHNQVERLTDPTAHAEMIALTAAFNGLGAKYLPDATLYVTLQPCLMCSGALYWSKVGQVVFGATDEKNGYARLTGTQSPFHPKTKLVTGILEEECAALMKHFFQARR